MTQSNMIEYRTVKYSKPFVKFYKSIYDAKQYMTMRSNKAEHLCIQTPLPCRIRVNLLRGTGGCRVVHRSGISIWRTALAKLGGVAARQTPL